MIYDNATSSTHVAMRHRALINNPLVSEILNWRRRSCAFATGPSWASSHVSPPADRQPGLARGLVLATRSEPHARARTELAARRLAGRPESRPDDDAMEVTRQGTAAARGKGLGRRCSRPAAAPRAITRRSDLSVDDGISGSYGKARGIRVLRVGLRY